MCQPTITISNVQVRTLHISIEPKEMSGLLNIDDADRKEYYFLMLEDVDEVLETKRTKEEPPIDDEIQPIETLVESESATDFRGLKLQTTLSSTSATNCFALMFKRKMDICMTNCDDHLRHFSETLTE